MKVQEMFLTPNKYSRPQIKLEIINGVVVHYVGNAGSTAIGNRAYFESNKDRQVYASSHYIIGLEGEIIQCIPENEIAYCSNNRNKDTISIECCHPKDDGKFNDKTLKSLKELLKDIISRYNLEKEDVIRHYDITGKKCPLYFVNNENEWVQFKNELFQQNNIEIIIDQLFEYGIISNAEYWKKAVKEVKYLDLLFENTDKAINEKLKNSDIENVEKAIDILEKNKIINSKDYWMKNYKSYKYLDDLIIKIAKQFV